MLRIEHPHHLQPANARHLDIQKKHVRAQRVYGADGFDGVGALAHHLDIALLLQQHAQVLPGQRFIINNQHL